VAFALLYTLAACHYFVLRSHTKLEHTQYAQVIPEVVDLEIYAQEYWNLGNLDYKNFYVSSYLEPITETVEDFQIRRIKWAIKRLDD